MIKKYFEKKVARNHKVKNVNTLQIGLWGFYGHDNFGDDLLLNLMINNIYENCSNCRIFIFGEKKIKNEDATIIPRNILNSVKMAFKLDVIFIGPGGLLPNKDRLKIIFFCLIEMIMRLRKKKCCIFGLGIGIQNFNSKINSRLIKKMLDLAYIAILRQKLEEVFYISPKIKSTMDYVFANRKTIELLKKERTFVLLTIADVFPAYCPENVEYEFINKLSELLKWLSQFKIDVVMLGLSGDRDIELARKIVETSKMEKKCTLINYKEVGMQRVLELFSCAKLSIAMRFHGLVLSLINNIPVYAIAYSEKTEDLCKRAGLDEYYQKVCFSKSEYYGKYICFDLDECKKKLYHMLSEPRSRFYNINNMLTQTEKIYSEAMYKIFKV